MPLPDNHTAPHRIDTVSLWIMLIGIVIGALLTVAI